MTIGGHPGPKGAHEDGTPVRIDDSGKITGGPAALEGKQIGHVDRDVAGTEEDQREPPEDQEPDPHNPKVGDTWTIPNSEERREFGVKVYAIDPIDPENPQAQRFAHISEPSLDDSGHDRNEDQDYGHSKIPLESLPHFVGDFSGKIDPEIVPPDSDDDRINAIVNGEGKFLGKGQDGAAYELNGEVIKASTPAAYHPFGGMTQHITWQDAMDNAVAAFGSAKEMYKAGIPGIPKMQLRGHGQKAFTITPKLDVPKDDEWKPEHLAQLRASMKDAHAKQYTFNDTVQAGIDPRDGRVYHFDLGQAGKNDNPDDGGTFSSASYEDDKTYLKRLYNASGVRFIPWGADAESTLKFGEREAQRQAAAGGTKGSEKTRRVRAQQTIEGAIGLSEDASGAEAVQILERGRKAAAAILQQDPKTAEELSKEYGLKIYAESGGENFTDSEKKPENLKEQLKALAPGDPLVAKWAETASDEELESAIEDMEAWDDAASDDPTDTPTEAMQGTEHAVAAPSGTEEPPTETPTPQQPLPERHAAAGEQIGKMPDATLKGLAKSLHGLRDVRKTGAIETDQLSDQYAGDAYDALKGLLQQGGDDFGEAHDLSSELGHGAIGYASPAGVLAIKPPEWSGQPFSVHYGVPGEDSNAQTREPGESIDMENVRVEKQGDSDYSGEASIEKEATRDRPGTSENRAVDTGDSDPWQSFYDDYGAIVARDRAAAEQAEHSTGQAEQPAPPLDTAQTPKLAPRNPKKPKKTEGAPAKPKRIPAQPKLKGLGRGRGRLKKALAEAVGDSTELQQELLSTVDEIHAMQSAQAIHYNAALDHAAAMLNKAETEKSAARLPRREARRAKQLAEAGKLNPQDRENESPFRVLQGRVYGAGKGTVDVTDISGLDEVAPIIAREYPNAMAAMGGGSDTSEQMQSLFDAIGAGKKPIPPSHDPDIIDEAMAVRFGGDDGGWFDDHQALSQLRAAGDVEGWHAKQAEIEAKRAAAAEEAASRPDEEFFSRRGRKMRYGKWSGVNWRLYRRKYAWRRRIEKAA